MINEELQNKFTQLAKDLEEKMTLALFGVNSNDLETIRKMVYSDEKLVSNLTRDNLVNFADILKEINLTAMAIIADLQKREIPEFLVKDDLMENMIVVIGLVGMFDNAKQIYKKEQMEKRLFGQELKPTGFESAKMVNKEESLEDFLKKLNITGYEK